MYSFILPPRQDDSSRVLAPPPGGINPFLLNPTLQNQPSYAGDTMITHPTDPSQPPIPMLPSAPVGNPPPAFHLPPPSLVGTVPPVPGPNGMPGGIPGLGANGLPSPAGNRFGPQAPVAGPYGGVIGQNVRSTLTPHPNYSSGRSPGITRTPGMQLGNLLRPGGVQQNYSQVYPNTFNAYPQVPRAGF